MPSVDLAIVTFNCARVPIDKTYFAKSLHETLAPPRTSSASSTASQEPPDIICLALEEVAPIAPSFLGVTFLAPYYAAFQSAIDTLPELYPTATPTRYEFLMASNAGMTALMLFAQPDVARNISEMESGEVRVGDYELGNKGAVGVRFRYGSEGKRLAFVAAHLAPHEQYWERRNADWRAIAENMVFEGKRTTAARRAGKSTSVAEAGEEEEPLLADGAESSRGQLADRGMYAPDTTVFVAGDLNYRTSDLSPHPDAHTTWPIPSLGFPETPISTTAKSDPDFSALREVDQLTRELRADRTLHTLHEAEVKFPPTYKYSTHAQDLAKEASFASDEDTPSTSQATEVKAGVWAKHRQPSWCDRILFSSPAAVQVKRYEAVRMQATSDHRPVVLHFDLDTAALAKEERFKAPFEISPDWRERRDRSRRKDFAVGVGAYLTTTWEGGLMVLGTVGGAVGGWALIRSMLVS